MARFKKLDVPHQWKDEFTKYPHGHSIFEALSKWVDLVNRMITNINAWNEYLGGFTSTFGEVPQQMVELRQEMMALLDNVNSNLTTITNEINGLADEVTGLADTLLSHLTNYASYLASELGEEHIIRTLPNGVKDEIDFGTGKLIKRVAEYTIKAEDITRVVTAYHPNYIIDISLTVLKGIVPQAAPISGSVSIGGMTEIHGGTSTMYWIDGTFGTNSTYLRIGSTTITTLAQAQTALAGTTVTYQLAEPEIIDLPEVMSPNTREIVRLSEQVDKLMNML